jgi:hypothetical protein
MRILSFVRRAASWSNRERPLALPLNAKASAYRNPTPVLASDLCLKVSKYFNKFNIMRRIIVSQRLLVFVTQYNAVLAYLGILISDTVRLKSYKWSIRPSFFVKRSNKMKIEIDRHNLLIKSQSSRLRNIPWSTKHMIWNISVTFLRDL